MSKVMHQMSATAERAGVARGEALRDPVSGVGVMLTAPYADIDCPFPSMHRISCSRGRCCSHFGTTLHTDPPVMLIFWALARMTSTQRSAPFGEFV
jgi:hypothetical protein